MSLGQSRDRISAADAVKAYVYPLWNELKSLMDEIFLKRSVPMPRNEWMNLYTRVFNCCMRERLDELRKMNVELVKKFIYYDAKLKLYKNIHEYLRNHIITVLKDSRQDLMDEEVLKLFVNRWETYKFGSRLLNSGCHFLNGKIRFYDGDRECPDAVLAPGIYQLAVSTWRDLTFEILHEQLKRAFLKLIERKRNGESVDICLLENFIDCYHQVGLNEADPSFKGENYLLE